MTDDAQPAVTVTVVGANGAFSRSFVTQARRLQSLALVGLCDRDAGALADSLEQMGFAPDEYTVAADVDQAQETRAAGRLVVTDSYEVALTLRSNVVVEATGVPTVGARVAARAADHGSHVVMINKEADSVAGVSLKRYANARGVRYEYAHGDQPRNLVDLVAWANAIGFDVVAAGKSSEYDYVVDSVRGTVTHLDKTVQCPDLSTVWHLGDDVAHTLKRRSQMLHELPQYTAPDYVEMNLVSNATGMLPSRPDFHYPLARITELADIYAPKEDGGVLEDSSVVDVFNLLRRDDEPSFGGGVFVVVRAEDAESWELLREKGHVVSRHGRYGCVYLPYHLMGLETVGTVIAAGRASRSDCPVSKDEQMSRRATVVVETLRDFSCGETLTPSGSHHEIEGVRALLTEWKREVGNAVPYHLAARSRLSKHVPAGSLVTLDMLEDPDDLLVEYWRRDQEDWA